MLLPAILHDGSSRYHFQIADLRQIRQHVVLNAIGKVSIGFVVAEIFKGQDRDRFLDLPRGNLRQEKKTGDTGY